MSPDHDPTPESTLTRLLHADRRAGVEQGALHKPMHPAATFGYRTAAELVAVFQGRQAGYVYARQGNPTGAALEAKLALLEGARAAAGFSTGMAAIAGILLALLKAGDHLVASKHLFGNTRSLLQTMQGFGLGVSFVDTVDAAAVEAALEPATRLVFVETIANPATQVADLDGIGRLCSARGLLYVVDNTMTTPALFQPRTVGAGLIVHSLTKGLSGHGDAMGGAVVDTGCFDWQRWPHIAEAYQTGDPAGWGLLQIRKRGLRDFGATLRAEDAHRIATGIETLALRSVATNANALALARWLEAQPAVERVFYPGLESHPQHARAKALFGGRFGGLLAFELKAGIDPLAVLDRLRIVILSSHLSDNRTLVIPVAQTIFWELGPQRRAEMGIADGLLRLSVGIEALADLQADWAQALRV
ncbi:cystathionine gamma-synthase family protein [Aquincola sp. S2]|uniref:Cystathionine gamma-synthase family protein n=1 Tax=Pseudaquabacterium terrae TaxID=2732868 RepID=A0ABX2EKZ3_9BURK|nr:cystathionine gamma-synthase family protein [Aquabacterium terrae]NRF69321.1 cystathionine gamma-synthase family protein [Aquabacterium terrae]